MADVQVGRLALRLVVPHALRGTAADGLRTRTEQRFLPAVLQAVGERLQREHGRDALMRIRCLRLRLAMPAGALDLASWIDTLSEDIAAQLRQTLECEHGGGTRPSATASVQVFRDAAHARAVALMASAGRGAPGAVVPPDFAAAWQSLQRVPASERHATLLRCHHAGGLRLVLARLSAAALRELESAWPAPVAVPVARALQQARRRALAAEARLPGADTAAAPAPDAPARDADRRAAAAPVAAPSASPDSVAVSAAPAVADSPASDAGTIPAEAADNVRPTMRSQRTPAPRAAASSPSVAPVDAKTPSARPAATAPPRPHDDAAQQPPAAACAPIYPSRWCALLYLLNISQRLDLPQRLWQVGVDEGATLATLMGRLCGVPDDPVATLLSRRFPQPPSALLPLPAWARDELDRGCWDAAQAWIGSDTGALRQRAAALRAWFAIGPGFDLAAWAAGLHLAIAERLLDERFAAGALHRRFARDGHIELREQQLCVCLPLDAIDVDMRRAGLDADPGWLPWLDRSLVFEFSGGEDLGDGP